MFMQSIKWLAIGAGILLATGVTLAGLGYGYIKYVDHTTKFECPICREDDCSEINTLPAILPCCQTKLCGHCLWTHTAGYVMRHRSEIPCPMPDCKKHIDPFEVTEILLLEHGLREINAEKMPTDRLLYTGSAFVNHYKMINSDLFKDAPNHRFCPHPECEYDGIIEDMNHGNPRYECPKCAKDCCFVCRDAWHNDQSCEIAQRTKYGDAYEGIKMCPKCCYPVQKNGGCNHMACRNPRCAHHFCFACLKPYRSMNLKLDEKETCSGGHLNAATFVGHWEGQGARTRLLELNRFCELDEARM